MKSYIFPIVVEELIEDGIPLPASIQGSRQPAVAVNS